MSLMFYSVPRLPQGCAQMYNPFTHLTDTVLSCLLDFHPSGQTLAILGVSSMKGKQYHLGRRGSFVQILAWILTSYVFSDTWFSHLLNGFWSYLFLCSKPKLHGLRQPYLFCSSIHHSGRAWQEQLISALLSANPGQLKGWGWSHLMPCSSRYMAPGLGRLQQPGLGTEAHLSISLWSLHVVCPACNSWVTRFCQFRAPKVVSERGLEEAASSMVQPWKSHGIPSPHSLHQGSHKDSPGFYGWRNRPLLFERVEQGLGEAHEKYFCNFGKMPSFTMGIIMAGNKRDLLWWFKNAS